ncbi:hypothetical protein CKM354_000711000 [Cercospora kikuchii]|uniref:WD40 repeat-like protein n=1 Tax=Cercospora kikuchii TaxID=84275 RepID=A0A9P3CJJ1_9PEZI|nr:uncharacterized protein CKM354_000711000 [Cercospora kikuchii]GIZ43898.1 hypothetical protein CKM354_000711000 [Cercospora kikuchii]
MAPSGSDVFPTLQHCSRLGTGQTLFDVQFWPFGNSDDEQIFAVTGGTETLVCRPRLGADPPFEVLRFFDDEAEPGDTAASLNSLAWAHDPISNKPWLCVAGAEHRHIKILDIESGEIARTLPGHGGAVNDLAVSPTTTGLLASASEDYTIRLWNLHPSFEAQPCVAILSKHQSPVLAIEFHPNGKWLISGGIDTAVCLWSVPLVGDRDPAGDWSTASKPLTEINPHFFTKELHPNYVDSFAFYGDLIISKAARDQSDAKKKHKYANEILLWKIDGFDADEPPPEHPAILEAGQYTGSSFDHDEGYHGFARLLTLDIPHTDRFYHRFGFFHAEGKRPLLCMGDQLTRFSFWDMQRFEEGIDPFDRPSTKPRKKNGRKKKGPNVLGELRRAESGASSTSGQTPDASSTGASSTTAPESREYTLSDRFTPLAAHYRVTANTDLTTVGSQTSHFATSQIAFSPNGTWMVTVGDHGMMCMFHRDESVT